MNPNIKGVIVPLVTPFNAQGEVDTTAVKPLVDFLIERGVKGLFPGGTTGEGPLLSASERRQLAEAVVAAADGQVPVIVHTGAITTNEAVELTNHAQAAGAQAAALVPPFYFHHSDDVLFKHFRSVATTTPEFPIYLYNNPSVTGNNLSLKLVKRLIEACPNIVGMKDSSGDLEMLFTIAAAYDGRFNTASGSDAQVLMSVSLGCDACVSGNANIVPELVVTLYNATAQGDLELARQLQSQLNEVRRLVMDGNDLSLFKGILARRGVAAGTVRAPLLQAPEAVMHECWQGLNALGLDLTPA